MVVVDANIVVALAVDDERAEAIEAHMRGWRDAGETLHAPSLLRYEVASALTRGIVAGQLDLSDAQEAWRQITAMPVTLHDLHDGPAVVALARQLRRESAYDAAYVVLAQKLGAVVWTLDGPLARNAAGSGLPVRLIEVARASG